MTVVWFQRFSNLLEGAGLCVRQLNEHAILPPGHMRLQEPEVIRTEKYLPDVSRTREYVWKLEKQNGPMFNSRDLAGRFLLQFLELVERDRAGKIKRKGWQ